jgi:hypothetical protein
MEVTFSENRPRSPSIDLAVTVHHVVSQADNAPQPYDSPNSAGEFGRGSNQSSPTPVSPFSPTHSQHSEQEVDENETDQNPSDSDVEILGHTGPSEIIANLRPKFEAQSATATEPEVGSSVKPQPTRISPPPTPKSLPRAQPLETDFISSQPSRQPGSPPQQNGQHSTTSDIGATPPIAREAHPSSTPTLQQQPTYKRAASQDASPPNKLRLQILQPTHIDPRPETGRSSSRDDTAAVATTATGNESAPMAKMIQNLVDTVKTLQEQVERQSNTLVAQVRSAALREQADEIQKQRLEDNESLLQLEVHRLQTLVNEQQRDDTTHAKIDDLEYTSRLESLLRTGYKLPDAHAALLATKLEGKFSVTRADAYLKSMATAARQKLMSTANSALPEGQPIVESSALGRLLGMPESADAIDIVVRCKDAHARQRSKAAHSANTAMSASNLIDLPCIKGDALMGRKGLPYLTQVATAVIEDCPKCSEQRNQVQVSETWKAAALASAKKDDRTATEKGKKRVTLPFKTADSHRDMKKPRKQCGECNKGWEGGKWLYFCDECNSGFHALCTDWKHLRRPDGGPTWFACTSCVSTRDRAVSQGHHHKQYVIVDEDIEHGCAPQCAEAAPEEFAGNERVRSNDHPFTTPGSYNLAEHPPNATAVAPLPLQTPAPAPHRHQASPLLPSTPGMGEYELNSSTKMDAKPSITVKDYFMWEVVPNDWTPRPDSKLKQHPERGYSKVAYQNWRRKNVSLRDSIKAQGSSLGPLVRGISADMKSSIAKQFLKEPLLSWLRPSPSMTDAEIDAWVKSDPESKWFDRIPDEQLLQLLDKRFGVKKPDLFLSKKFYDNLPPMDDYGDVNYHADVFNRWAVEWNTELTELQKSGCDFSDVDLRQTLLNAVSTNKLIHQQALQYNTTSVYLLLAHLRDWVIQEEESVIAQRNKKTMLISTVDAAEATQPRTSSQSRPSPKAGSGGPGEHHGAKSMVLMTQTQLRDLVQAGQGQPKDRPMPPHLRLRDSNKVLCRGCNNTWDRARSIPCFKACKFVDHPEYNKECKEKETKTAPLTWRRFREKYPSLNPPEGFLKWEEREKNFRPSRPSSPTPRPKHPRDE